MRDLGPWEPATVAEVRALFEGAPFRWWVQGGRALDLHAGRSWREHGDTDVGILRADAPAAARLLRGLDRHIAAQGRLRPWEGSEPSEAAAENNIWVGRAPGSPWWFDLTLGEGDADCWIFRRDRSVRLPWSAAVLIAPDGTPYLAPEAVLLSKSRAPLAKDHNDAQMAIPTLAAESRAWLCDRLPTGHPWRGTLGGALS